MEKANCRPFARYSRKACASLCPCVRHVTVAQSAHLQVASAPTRRHVHTWSHVARERARNPVAQRRDDANARIIYGKFARRRERACAQRNAKCGTRIAGASGLRVGFAETATGRRDSRGVGFLRLALCGRFGRLETGTDPYNLRNRVRRVIRRFRPTWTVRRGKVATLSSSDELCDPFVSRE